MRETKGLAKHFREASAAGKKRMRVKSPGAASTPRVVPSNGARTQFVFKCVDCQTKNRVNPDQTSEDAMYYCSRCGFDTVQTLHAVEAVL